jgi:hypothetical protein
VSEVRTPVSFDRRGPTLLGPGQLRKLLGRFALRSLSGVMERPLVATRAR